MTRDGEAPDMGEDKLLRDLRTADDPVPEDVRARVRASVNQALAKTSSDSRGGRRQNHRNRGVRRVLLVAAAAAALAIAVGPAIGRRFDTPEYDPGALERSQHLTGLELLRALDAQPILLEPGDEIAEGLSGVLVNGEKVSGCPAPEAPLYTLVAEDSDTWYCVSVADRYEVWQVHELFRGHVPTEAEKARMREILG